MKRLTFKKEDRLLKRSEFRNLKKHGRKIEGRLLIAIVYQKSQGNKRLGITVTRRVAKANQRNRIKRIAREFFRLNRQSLQKSWDINLIAKRDAAEANNLEIQEDLNFIFKKLRSLEIAS